METIRNRIFSVVLFGTAPFFFFPPKAGINSRYGSSFEVAYYHFRQNHVNAVNLALHAVCLFVQLFGNFGLLNEMDNRNAEKTAPLRQLIPDGIVKDNLRIASAVTALLWIVVQFRSSAPKYVSLLSALCIALAYFVAPLLTVEYMDALSFGGFLIMLLLSNLASGGKIVTTADTAKVFFGMPLLRLGWSWLEANYFELRKDEYQTIQWVCIGWVVALPLLLRNPVKPLVVSSTFLLRLAYVLTGNKMLFFLSYGFFGSLLQGITHLVSKEEATLIALERKGDNAKIAFEYGHVVYFPNLAINALLDTFFGVAPPKKPEDLKE